MQLDFMPAGQVHTNHTIFICPGQERTTQRELANGQSCHQPKLKVALPFS